MEILLVPHPVLRQKANKLKSISKEDIKIANHMMEAMIKAPGVGLAANQVGILKQIVTINFEDKENGLERNFFTYMDFNNGFNIHSFSSISSQGFSGNI